MSWKALPLFCLLASGASPVSASPLDELLSSVRASYPSSQVTGSFWDWRAPSRYRRLPGLHSGYDLSAPAGTPIATPWSGQVVAIAPWSGGEWGVTVRVQDYSVTFGHLVPCVRVGESLRPGQKVGSVARDHVDVKMRDGSQRFVDFRLISNLAPPSSAPVGAAVAPAVKPPAPPSAAQLEAERERRRLLEEGVATVDED